MMSRGPARASTHDKNLNLTSYYENDRAVGRSVGGTWGCGDAHPTKTHSRFANQSISHLPNRRRPRTAIQSWRGHEATCGLYRRSHRVTDVPGDCTRARRRQGGRHDGEAVRNRVWQADEKSAEPDPHWPVSGKEKRLTPSAGRTMPTLSSGEVGSTRCSGACRSRP